MPKKDKEQFTFDANTSIEKVIEVFENLLDGLKKKKILLTSGPSSIVLYPEDVMKLEIEAKKKEDKSKIEIELKWKSGFMERKNLTVDTQ